MPQVVSNPRVPAVPRNTTETEDGARVRIVANLPVGEIPQELSSYIYALTNCLTVEELIGLLARSYATPGHPRRAVLRALSRIERVDRKKSNALTMSASKLIAIVQDGSYKDAIAAAYCMSEIVQGLQRPVVQRYLTVAAAHRYGAVRRRAHRIARDFWTTNVSLALRDGWRLYNDESAARTLIFCDASDVLATYADEFFATEVDPYLVSRLLIKVHKQRPDLLRRARRSDPISYAYVLAKIGKRVSSREAKELLEAAGADQRLGLLIWALGVMGAWKVLVDLRPKLCDLARDMQSSMLRGRGP